jgi:hypothetical protein
MIAALALSRALCAHVKPRRPRLTRWRKIPLTRRGWQARSRTRSFFRMTPLGQPATLDLLAFDVWMDAAGRGRFCANPQHMAPLRDIFTGAPATSIWKVRPANGSNGEAVRMEPATDELGERSYSAGYDFSQIPRAETCFRPAGLDCAVKLPTKEFMGAISRRGAVYCTLRSLRSSGMLARR